jgi:hypothetical protein
MRLWIGNLAPGTNDDELKTFVKKYQHELECEDIERVEGEGTHPAAIMRFSGGTPLMLTNLALRLNGMYWKGKPLRCNTMVR